MLGNINGLTTNRRMPNNKVDNSYLSIPNLFITIKGEYSLPCVVKV